ncbi:PREDICTED: uncharacterized protein LOC105360040 [Ceratosolen solmsi marchali]|uniref:Uncharacterized protein LOC105360040 n=1 Tax=Ceratosolen solmsi marchali TaxID=326594 RepID=A0AAJ6VLV0_9HYME|nr:PREDICTED: uncharacterized protein LOC105360040 [Ceratosolen solmsi marchali]
MTASEKHYTSRSRISRPVDIVFEADAYGQIIKSNIINYSSSVPIAQLSIFGLLVIGTVNLTNSLTLVALHTSTQNAEDTLTRFWVQEEVPNSDNHLYTYDEQYCEDRLKKTHSRDSTGRHIVRIPLKTSVEILGDSQNTVHRYLQSLIRRFSKDGNYCQHYQQFITEYEELKHMKRASSVSHHQTHYYLLHHSILEPDSATIGLRIVLNGSSVSTSGHSINNIMHTGGNLNPESSDVLIWIR